MELKKIILTLIFVLFSNTLNAELIKPNKTLSPYDVVEVQLKALKNNDSQDRGIRQTWLFAHPDNKKVTGPYERFRIMIYGEQYKYLINHSYYKIRLITNSPNSFVYRIEILSKKKKLIFYEWHVQKGNDVNCEGCWFTSAVSKPVDQGNTI
ncbi:MAG: hypothetical protein CMJ01_03620 [Pelagibacteraceae bacterium]|nr:hypothetical protein [Pelagibacteraceae bacterium]|tara:strand:+ start:3815 stop:4270 length:456 start_codon:yes stop_codon:yes gene_type:complete